MELAKSTDFESEVTLGLEMELILFLLKWEVGRVPK
jgi:hypothetical protein